MSDEGHVRLSAVIVTYENENEIADCLETLFLELRELRAEVVVVDNNSGDRTMQIVENRFREENEFDCSLMANESNLGFTKALNRGLRKCSGEMVLVLNPDTKFNKGSLRVLCDSLQRNKAGGVAAPQLLNPDGSVQSSCRRFPRRRDVLYASLGLSYLFPKSGFNAWKMGDFDHRHSRSVDQPQGACLLFRRKLLESVGLWDERFPMFFSDVDWCRRVKQKGIDIIFEPRAKVVHQKGVSITQKRVAMIWSSHKSFYLYFRKYAPNSWSIIPDILTGILLFFSAIPRTLGVWVSWSN